MRQSVRSDSSVDSGSPAQTSSAASSNELVIPKIWLRSGKNISLVAKNLSIPPKKVRRILRSTNKV